MAFENANPHLEELDEDFLYHLGLTSKDPLPELFGDVQYVCMGGSDVRADDFAGKLHQQLGLPIQRFSRDPDSDIQTAEEATDALLALLEEKRSAREVREAIAAISDFARRELDLPTPIGKTERFELYKAGPVICVSHGMGMPSMQILLDEITKLLMYAGCKDLKYIRIGTSGGVGVPRGDVVIASGAVNDELGDTFRQAELGFAKHYPTQLDEQLAKGLLAAAGNIKAQIGKTMGTDNFYLGQGRHDGYFDPGYTEKDKLGYLSTAHEEGVRNIEMEAPAFAAFCLRAGIPAAIVCASLLNRLEGDQVTATPEELEQYSDNAEQVVINWLRTQPGIREEV